MRVKARDALGFCFSAISPGPTRPIRRSSPRAPWPTRSVCFASYWHLYCR